MNAIRVGIRLSVMPKQQEEDREQLSNYVIDYIIEKTLIQIFGEASTRLIYEHLESNHHLRREDVPENLELFFSGLEEMYGFGAKVLKRIVLKKLHAKIGSSYEEKEGYSFSDYVRELKTPKRLKVDEKAVIRTNKWLIKESKMAKVVKEQPPEPAGEDRQEKIPKKRIQVSY